MDTLLQDLRFGIRMLWKHRLTTVVCIVALALGIGANTVMFSLAEAFLLHPVPLENVDRLLALANSRPEQNILMSGVSPAAYLQWRNEAKSFDQLGAYSWDEVNLTGDREPQKVDCFRVTSNLFATLGVRPKIGRTFLPEEEYSGKGDELILGYGLWERRYASDPNIIGKTVKVDGKLSTIAGVMGKGFDFPLPAEAWMPMTLDAKERSNWESRRLSVIGHLSPGVPASTASAEMTAIAALQSQAHPDTNKGWQLRIMPLSEFVTGAITRQYTLMLMGAVAFVLLIACADVANVQFARVSGRSKEFAIRTALGGSRWRVGRQLLTESILLSLAGAAIGLVFAQWDVELIRSHMPADVAKFIAGWKTIRLDAGAFLLTLGLTLVSGVLSGIAPALLTSRSEVGEKLKETGRGSSAGRSRHRLRGALVVLEVSLALILLVGAGLLVKNFRGLLAVNEGYSPESVLTMNLSLPEVQYKDPQARLAFHEQTLQRLGSVPGVRTASIATSVPYANGGGAGTQDFSIEGRPLLNRGESRAAIVETVSPGYLDILRLKLRDGRLLTGRDTSDSNPVAVISESLARRYFPGETALGRHVKLGKDESEKKWMTVIGIVNDVHYGWIEKDDIPTLYVPFRQSPPYYTTLVLRTVGEPLQLVSAVRAEVGAVDPNLPLFNIKPFDRVITESIIGIAYVAAMMSVLGLIALVLATVGVYGVMSYAVTERTHEIGIRLSLGATTSDVLRLVLRSGMLLTVLGLVIGLPIAFLLARAMSSLLFGVGAADPVAFLGLTAVLAAVAVLACYIPARRAAQVDPLLALRHD